MCDEWTEAEQEVREEKLRLSRRDVGLGAGSTLAGMLTGCASAPSPVQQQRDAADPSVAEPTPNRAEHATTSREVTIDTPDGVAEGFFVAAAGAPRPGVLLWPDVAGLRDAYRTMAARLAREGYAVLVVNPYYRSTKLPLFAAFSEWKTEAGKKKVQPMRDALTPEAVTSDSAAFVAWLDRQKDVDTKSKIAAMGYCMGGPFALRTAAAAPARVGVVASFHGGGLVTSEPTSPHLLLSKIQAAVLICIAQNDHDREPAAQATLQRAAEAADLPAEIEVYPAAHGWCTIDSPVYDEIQAERAWARLLATLERYL